MMKLMTQQEFVDLAATIDFSPAVAAYPHLSHLAANPDPVAVRDLARQVCRLTAVPGISPATYWQITKLAEGFR